MGHPLHCVWGTTCSVALNAHVMGGGSGSGSWVGHLLHFASGGWAALVVANLEPCLDLLASRGDPGQQWTATRPTLRRHRTQRQICISLPLHCAAGPCQPVQFGFGDRWHLRHCSGALPLANSMHCLSAVLRGWITRGLAWPGLVPLLPLLLGLAAALPRSSLWCCTAGTFTLALSHYPRTPLVTLLCSHFRSSGTRLRRATATASAPLRWCAAVGLTWLAGWLAARMAGWWP